MTQQTPAAQSFSEQDLETASRGMSAAGQLRDSQLTSDKGMMRGGHGGPPAAHAASGPSAPFKQTIDKLLAYLRPVLPAMVLAIIAAIIGVILNIIAPQFLADITDEIQKGFMGDIDMAAVSRLMWISIALLVCSLLLSLVEGVIMARSTVWVSKNMRSDLDRKIDALPLSYLDQGSTGDTLSRVTNDVDTLQQTLNNSLATTITGVDEQGGVAQVHIDRFKPLLVEALS